MLAWLNGRKTAIKSPAANMLASQTFRATAGKPA